MPEPYLSDEAKAGRISCHGKITSLAAAFKLKNGNMFSLFIIPTDDTVKVREISAKLYHEQSASDCPFSTFCWTETAIAELPINSINLTQNTVYWGSPVFDEPAV